MEAGGSGSFSGLLCGVGETFSVGCSLQLQNSLTPPAVGAVQAALAREGRVWGPARSCWQHSWMSLVQIWCLSSSAATLQSLLEATSVGAQLCRAPLLHTVRG